jgi:hypothetical protein
VLFLLTIVQFQDGGISAGPLRLNKKMPGYKTVQD